jgi:hypothetical protein
MIIINILYLIVLIITIIAIVKKQKSSAIVGVVYLTLIMLAGYACRDLYGSYRESSWKKLIQFISKEIENGNGKDVKSGIDTVNSNYSKHSEKSQFMGYQYRGEIERMIKQKKATNQKIK